MAGLKEIKNKIKSVDKTRKVTRAMEAVSAVKMRKSQDRALRARPYARSALRILRQISSIIEFKTHPLVVRRDAGTRLVILVTSDKGLAGSLNSAVLKLAEKFVKDMQKSDIQIEWICIGKRGLDWVERRGYKVLHSIKNVSDSVEETEMQEISDVIINMQESGKTQKVDIIYTNFKSTFEQEPVVRRVLPLSYNTLNEIVAGILPTKGKWADMPEENLAVPDYEIEPSRASLLSEVLPRLVNILVFHTLLENKASEHSARMVAMKNATDKAGEVGQVLKRKFNKVRQATITAEIGEITSGLEAMK